MATKLRRWRKAKGVTLQEVSDLTGVSVPMLSLVETGKRRMAPMSRIRFARLLGVTVGDIFAIEGATKNDHKKSGARR